jgi:hypothetical protein
MITENPQWVDPQSFPISKQKESNSLISNFTNSFIKKGKIISGNSTNSPNLIYDNLGPIPFPKDKTMSNLEKLMNSILSNSISQEEAKAVFKIKKKLKKKISDLQVDSEKFQPTLFSNVFTTKNYKSSSHEIDVFRVDYPHLSIDENINIFQSLSKSMDEAFYPPHCMTIQATTLVHKSFMSSFDLSPCDLQEFCSQVKIDPILIDLVGIDYSDDYPNHCKITIEKRIPF